MGKKEEVLTEYGVITWDRSKPQEEQWEMAPKWSDKYEEKQDRYMLQKITEEEFESWVKDSSNFEVTPVGLHTSFEDEDEE